VQFDTKIPKTEAPVAAVLALIVADIAQQLSTEPFGNGEAGSVLKHLVSQPTENENSHHIGSRPRQFAFSCSWRPTYVG
jgi:hypothetical protein